MNGGTKWNFFHNAIKCKNKDNPFNLFESWDKCLHHHKAVGADNSNDKPRLVMNKINTI